MYTDSWRKDISQKATDNVLHLGLENLDVNVDFSHNRNVYTCLILTSINRRVKAIGSRLLV